MEKPILSKIDPPVIIVENNKNTSPHLINFGDSALENSTTRNRPNPMYPMNPMHPNNPNIHPQPFPNNPIFPQMPGFLLDPYTGEFNGMGGNGTGGQLPFGNNGQGELVGPNHPMFGNNRGTGGPNIRFDPPGPMGPGFGGGFGGRGGGSGGGGRGDFGGGFNFDGGW